MHCQGTFDAKRHVLCRVKTTQAANEAGQTPVAHHTGGGVVQVNEDVAQGSDLKVLGRQVVGLDVDKAGERRHRAFVDAVGKVAIEVEVNARLGLCDDVIGVAVAGEVKGLAGIAQAAGGEHHFVNFAVRVLRAVVTRAFETDRSLEHQVFTGHQFKQSVGRQTAVQSEGAAAPQNQRVGRQHRGQLARVGVFIRAFAKLDISACAVFQALRCGKEAVKLHRIKGGKTNATGVDQGLARGGAQHRDTVVLAFQADRIALDEAAVACPPADGHTAHAQLALHRQTHVISTGCGRGDDRAQHVQALGFFQVAIHLKERDVTAGGAHIQRVQCHLQAGDAQGSLYGQHIGHQINIGVDKGLEHTPGCGGEEHIALRAQAGVGHHRTGRVQHHRRLRNVGRIKTGHNRANKHVAHRSDANVIGIVVGQRAHIHQVHRASGHHREGAISHFHVVELEQLAALIDEHIAHAFGLQAQAVHAGEYRCGAGAQPAVDGQAQVVGLNGFGGIHKTQLALHLEDHVATAHAGGVAGGELAHPKVGCGRARSLVGAHRDVVAVTQAQGFELHGVYIARIDDVYAAVFGQRARHGQVAGVDQADVAHARERQVDERRGRVERDAAVAGGRHLSRSEQTAGQQPGGDHVADRIGEAA